MAAVTHGTAIVARGLTKRYGDLVALDDLDLDIPVGSVFGLLGPNGAGKTTALRLLTGLGHATAGSARVAGIEVGADPGALARRIGVLDQNPRLFGWMRGRELLEFSGRLLGLDGRILRIRVDEVLELVGLTSAARRPVGGYSGGMRQRLGIGAAILHRPAVLFLDEPVSALDPEGRRDVLEIIAGLRDNATIVMSTHILGDVERICDQVAILDHGRLVTASPLEMLLESHARPLYVLEPEPGQATTTERFLAATMAAGWADRAEDVDGMIRIHVRDEVAAAAAILPLVARSGLELARFERARPTLEDVFLSLVSRDDKPTAQEAA